MKSQKFIQNIALAMTIATAGSFCLPSLVSAKSVDNPTQVQIQSTSASVDATSMSKYSKCIKLNSTTKQFEVLPSASKNLTTAELKLIHNTLLKSNGTIQQVLKDENLSTQVTTNGTLKVEPKTQAQSDSPFMVLAINLNANWDYEMYWWGPHIFLSHALVQNLSQNVGNTLNYYVSGAASKALQSALEKVGLDSGPAGWIAFAVGGETVYNYDHIVSKCTSRGVFVDVNWVAATNIYGA
jgi:hypothetical protein